MGDQARQTGQGGAGMGSDPDPGSGSAGQGGGSEANPGVGETGIPLPTGDKPNPRGGSIDPDFEDVTEPTGDANFPDPSKPILMASRPDRGQGIREGGYGDSRGNGEVVDSPSTADGTGIRSGSHLNDDDSKSETDIPQGSGDRPGYPDVSQPANVDKARQ